MKGSKVVRPGKIVVGVSPAVEEQDTGAVYPGDSESG
jgi:hypothetical protein